MRFRSGSEYVNGTSLCTMLSALLGQPPPFLNQGVPLLESFLYADEVDDETAFKDIALFLALNMHQISTRMER